jgi:hypothetical protein
MAEVVGRDSRERVIRNPALRDRRSEYRRWFATRDAGLAHPEKVMLCRHAAPTRHLPLIVRGQEAGCVEALDRLNVPLNSTRDYAGGVLRDNNYAFGNGVIGLALKARRSSASCGTKAGRDGQSPSSTVSSAVRPQTPP